ncbi:MAG: hypothetical protein ACOYNO_11965 [Saprospiraceae bacterium]|jgi:cell division protein FtsB
MYLPNNPWNALWGMLPKWLQNRYAFATVLFLFVMLILDRHNALTQWRLYRAKQRLESDKVFYKAQIKDAREEAEDFELTKEKFARENYYMKRSDEDVYIIEENK